MTRTTQSHANAVTTLIASATGFYQRGWMLGTGGNLSVALRDDPVVFLVTASGRPKGKLGPADFVEVDAAGAALSPDAPKPSDETLIHAALYRQTNAGAVYHVHQISAALCSTLDEAQGFVELTDIEMLKGIGVPARAVARIPIVDNDPDIPALAREIERVMNPEVPAVLIRRHGVYTWGPTADDAHRHIEILDYLFEYRCRLAQLGR